MERTDYISASELGDYTYCKRGWWLRMQGLIQPNFAMREGNEAHDSLFQQLMRLDILKNILLYGGIVVLVIIILLLIFL